MIKVSWLTKIYDKYSAPALDGVSFNLPDAGLVFVVGKSGSGKSTLLNILGGLDNLTEGEVVVDGNSLSDYSAGEFDDYRNAYVGFVYQDFCLFEDMTVRENVRLCLDLKGESDEEKIEQIIRRVGLEGFIDRPARKLSGGQKQRVAIARALIKSPRMILADEPTGNLDSKTSKQILELLCELSKDSLVIVVSHNHSDANKYADRIIELSDGKIIRDEESTGEENSLMISEREILLPYSAVLSEDELSLINESKQGRRIGQRSPAFQKTVQPQGGSEKSPLKRSRIRRSAIFGLWKKFFVKRKLSFLVTAIVLAIASVVLALCQSFSVYDGQTTVDAVFAGAEDRAFILKKGRLSEDIFAELKKDKLGRITQDEIDAFYENGYEGKVFCLTNATMGAYASELEYCREVDLDANFKDFYAKINLGLLECDEAFLTQLYGKNGEIEVLAGTLDYTQKPYGMILTDYMADSYIYHNPHFAGISGNPYQKLIDTDCINNRFSVLAVIDTGYKERYAELIDAYGSYFKAENALERDRLMREITGREDYLDFYSELTGYLAICYSTNPNYRQDAIDYTMQSRVVGYFNNLDIYDTQGNLLTEGLLLQCSNQQFASETESCDKYGYKVEENDEIYIKYSFYNDLFGTRLTPDDTSAFEEKTVVFKNYDVTRDREDEPLYTKTYRIVGVTHEVGIHALLTDEEFKSVRQYDVYTTALYFTSVENCAEIYRLTEGTPFYPANQSLKAVCEVVDVVEIFREYFNLLTVMIAAIGLLILIGYHAGNLKSRRYEIGVLRSLGGKVRDIGMIFFLQSLLIGMVTSLLFALGAIMLTDLVNGILVESFRTYIDLPATKFLNEITVLEMSGGIIAVDIIFLLTISVISSLVPLLTIHRIKPINIVRSRE